MFGEIRAAASLVEAEVENEADDIDDLSLEDETIMDFGGGNG